MTRSSRLVSALCLFLPCLFAQFGSGIQGTVIDNSGAVMPNVQVVVTNLQTGVARQVLTSDTRIFRVLGIFTAQDFPKPVLGTDGTLGRNTFRGPGFARVDLSLEKGIQFTERVGGALRLEAYNSFNRVNLNSPATDLTSNNFGKVTSAAAGRLYTVSIRLRF